MNIYILVTIKFKLYLYLSVTCHQNFSFYLSTFPERAKNSCIRLCDLTVVSSKDYKCATLRLYFYYKHICWNLEKIQCALVKF